MQQADEKNNGKRMISRITAWMPFPSKM